MKNLNILFLFLVVNISAQTHRFVYDVVYRPDSTSNNVRKTNYYLDVNPAESFYYERNFFVSDSIEKASGKRIFEGKVSDLISKNLKTKQYVLYSIQNFEVYQLKDHPSIDWKIQNETKNIASLKVQRATAKFGGRQWIAWFSEEYPFQEGPYKFYGLPGLIVEIYDDKENYHFTLNKSENFKNTRFISFFKNAKERGIEIPYSKYQSMLLNYYQDPLKYISSGQMDINENNKLMLDDGKMIYKLEDLRQYSKDEQNRLRKYNNPVEIDKAVHYPQK